MDEVSTLIYMNTDTNSTETTKCRSCQTWEAQEAGEETTQSDRTQADLWGCTCDADTAAEKADHFARNHG